jgi:hypothetical protein
MAHKYKKMLQGKEIASACKTKDMVSIVSKLCVLLEFAG